MHFLVSLATVTWTLFIILITTTLNLVSANDPAIYQGMGEYGNTNKNSDDLNDFDEDDAFDTSTDLDDDDLEFTPRLEPMTQNQSPIIGVLVHKYVAENVHAGRWECDEIEGKDHSYVPSCIIKFIEAGGARTVPIRANGDHKYLRKMFNNVNGIYYPGAETGLHHSEYAKAGKFLYRLAVNANDAGTYFPLWGECLGLQFLLMTAAAYRGVFKTSCDSLDVSYAINFTNNVNESRLFGQMSPSLISAMASHNLTAHNHEYCVKVETFEKFQFNQPFRILSTNYEPNSNSTFVSAAEGVNYPFYALGFHPESNMYIWGDDYDIDHSPAAIEMAQYFSRFLANEARKNGHRFKSKREEMRSLMFNYKLSCNGDIYFIPRSKK